jgi:hypothetical protein
MPRKSSPTSALYWAASTVLKRAREPSGDTLKRFIVVLICVGAAVITPIVAAASTQTTPKPHIVGAWANDAGFVTDGGWVLWSNGAVHAYAGASNYGNATGAHLNNFVGMVPDIQASGYWLITGTGRVFSFGTTCGLGDGSVRRPAGVPGSGIVGAIDLTNPTGEGFVMVSATGKLYRFDCMD